MELGFGGTGARTHHGGDLRMGVALDRVQDEHGPRSVGQGRDRAVEVEAGIDLRLGGLELAGPGRALFAKDAALVGPPLAKHDVDRQSVQPGSECGVAAKPIQSLPSADKDLLRAGLGVVVIATGEPPTQP